MATHSSVLAWRIPGTGEPGGLPSMGSHTVRHDRSDLAAAAAGQRMSCLHSVSPIRVVILEGPQRSFICLLFMDLAYGLSRVMQLSGRAGTRTWVS